MNRVTNPSWDLPEAIIDRLGQSGPGRQRMMFEKGHLLLILHTLPKDSDGERKGVSFWRSPEGDWKASEGGAGLAKLKMHLETYQKADERLDDRLHEAKSPRELLDVLREVSPVLRAAKNLYNVLESAREAEKKVRELIDLRDQSYEIQRSLDLLYTEAKNTVDYEIARQNELQAQLGYQSIKSSHRLNILAAIFFPLMTVSGVFGMNMTNGISNDPWFFWLVNAMGLSLGIFTIIWVLRPVKIARSSK